MCSCSLQDIGHCLILLTNDMNIKRVSGQFYIEIYGKFVIVIVKVVKCPELSKSQQEYRIYSFSLENCDSHIDCGLGQQCVT